MKAILLAGGRGTRLKPFTNYINKHLLPLGNKPIIQHSVETLKYSGITDIAVVLGDFNCGDIVEFLGNGSEFGVKITYYFQGEAKGIAHAVNCAKNFVKDEDKFLVYLGDSIFSKGITRFVSTLEQYKLDFGLIFAAVMDAHSFGVPVYDENGTLIKIEEKPTHPLVNIALAGCYCFPKGFFEIFDTLKPSARGEYELTDIANILIETVHPMLSEYYGGWWMDAGTFEGIKFIEERLNEPN